MRKLKVTELSLIEAFFTSLVVGLAETYFPAFSLLKGASSVQAGVLVSIPMIFAILFQWVLLKKFKDLNLSTWVPLAAGVQLVSLFGLTLLAITTVSVPVFWLFILYSIYWAGHFSSIPAWNKWISDLVSMEESQKYFSARTRITQIGIVIGLFIGGVLLHLKKLNMSSEYLFASLFAVCSLFKFFTYKLFKSHTKSYATIHFDQTKAIHLLKQFKSFFSRYVVFNFTVYFSAPFVASYLLTDKNLSYDHFMWVMIGLFVGKILMTIVLSNIKDSISANKLLFFGAIASAPLPILWSFCSNVPLMVGLHLISGLAWGCWDVGLSLTFFKNIKAQEKIEVVSIYYTLNVLTQVAGTIAGVVILKFMAFNNYEILFIIAGIFRLLTAFGLKNKNLGRDTESNLAS